MMNGELDGGQVVVLVVDDDPLTLLLHALALEGCGFSVTKADNGQAALALFAEQKPSIILLDVQMPGMDGFEVCREIRSRPGGRDVPILMITGVDDVDSIKQAFHIGATDFVAKPIKPIILTERVRYMLRASSAFQELKKAQEAAIKAQKIARLGGWELTMATNTFRISEQVRSICGCDGPMDKTTWEDFLQCAHPEDRGNLGTLMQNALRFGKSQFIDHRVVLPNHSERIVSHQIEVELDEGGEVSRLYGTVQDVTERKRTESFEADRNRILQSIIQNQPLSDILNDLVKAMEHQFPGGTGCLCLVQDERIAVAAAPGLSETFVQVLNSLPVGPESGCLGSTAYLGQPMIAPDISRSPFWLSCLDAASQEGIRASFSAPILSGKGRMLGTISLFFGQVHHASQEDIKLTEKMAQMAAIAIEQCHLSELLVHQAKHDALTGLLNRSALAQLLSYRVNGNGGGPKSSSAALLLIDLDRFKRINDSLGHQIGDLLLCQVAERLRDCVRKNDLLGRIGGDEFLLALYPLSKLSDAKKAAERILKGLTKPFYVQGHQLHIGASIGISVFPDDGQDTAVVQKNADIAMYVAKNEGGNCFQFFSQDMNASFSQRLQIENDLRKGIERDEFELHYQPQYDLKSGKLVALEALIRWNHPENGRIPPDRFIPIAEETMLIIPIGAWVIREACRQSALWLSQGYPPIRVAVNVSAAQFTQPDFAQIVASALQENHMDPGLLEIEITETVILRDKEVVRKNLGELKKMGVVTTIDDFGTGYSSITYLRQMPLDCLKIDRSFINELFGEEVASLRTRNLVKAFVALAKNLNLKLVAEGIENTEQCEFVSMLGCEMGQGFLFSAPLPAREIASIFDEGQTNTCQSHESQDHEMMPRTVNDC
jgi:diguanylate cyclase (GGDEF)-like protein